MADRLYEQDDKESYKKLGVFIERLLVMVQVALVVLTVWTVVALSVHTYLLKREFVKMKSAVQKESAPIWYTENTDKLREDVALEYLLMSTTSTGIIIVIPDER